MWGEESPLIVQRPLGPLINSPVGTLPVFQGGVELSMEGQAVLPRGRVSGGSWGWGLPDSGEQWAGSP